MLLLYHSHKHISYPIRTIARSAILSKKLVRVKLNTMDFLKSFRVYCIFNL
ncbi:hypothetical protein OZD68_01895 [Wolbachia endosymbiont of Drosophila bicornuta]|nr:hypothetical protein [Wolbachia endosymbiont of Drosophila bicornuta]MDE5056348.1 hypothetical protein [Wolbachia endosymbiont of Drosophila bicornuta]